MAARKGPIKGRKPGTGSKRKRPGVPTSGKKRSAKKMPPELLDRFKGKKKEEGPIKGKKPGTGSGRRRMRADKK